MGFRKNKISLIIILPGATYQSGCFWVTRNEILSIFILRYGKGSCILQIYKKPFPMCPFQHHLQQIVFRYSARCEACMSAADRHVSPAVAVDAIAPPRSPPAAPTAPHPHPTAHHRTRYRDHSVNSSRRLTFHRQPICPNMAALEAGGCQMRSSKSTARQAVIVCRDLQPVAGLCHGAKYVKKLRPGRCRESCHNRARRCLCAGVCPVLSTEMCYHSAPSAGAQSTRASYSRRFVHVARNDTRPIVQSWRARAAMKGVIGARCGCTFAARSRLDPDQGTVTRWVRMANATRASSDVIRRLGHVIGRHRESP